MHPRFAIAIGLAVLLGSGPTPSGSGHLRPSSPEANRHSVPIAALVVHGATEDHASRLEAAFRRFDAAGLTLPPLTVTFHTDQASCKGYAGIFRARGTSFEIHICSETPDTVYEHELAHAWAFHSLDKDKRHAFMGLLGFETWNDQSVEWNRRGAEGVATVIQQGLSGLPLPPLLSPKTRLRIQAYRVLTGKTSPRYLEWITSSPHARGEAGLWVPGYGSRWMVN